MVLVQAESPNLDWGLTPQQDQSLNAEVGIKHVVDSVNESVRKKVDEDRQFDKQLLDLTKDAHGAYQNEILESLTTHRDSLKSLGKVNWNSIDLTKARTKILAQLQTDVAKSKFIAERVPQLYTEIEKDKYMIKDPAKQAVYDLLYKDGKPRSIKDLDIAKIEGITRDYSYKNVPAMMKDAAANLYEENITSDPWVREENGMLITNQINYRGGLFKPKLNAEGKPETDSDGKPVLETTLNPAQTKEIMEMTGNYESTYKYFETLLRSKLKGGADPKNDGTGDLAEQQVLDFASNTIETFMAPSVKPVGSPTQKYIDPAVRAEAAERAKGKQQRLDDDATVKNWTNQILSLKPESLKNEIKTMMPNVEAVIFAEGTGWTSGSNGANLNYYIDKGGKILTFNELLKNPTTAKYFKQTVKDGKLSAVLKPEYNGTIKPFTGIAIKQKTGMKGKGSTAKPIYTWTALEGNPKDPESSKNLATSVLNTVRKSKSAYATEEGETTTTTETSSSSSSTTDPNSTYTFKGANGTTITRNIDELARMYNKSREEIIEILNSQNK